MSTEITTAQEALEKARRELIKAPSAYLDEYREPCELIIRERGVRELARVTRLSRTTVQGWARRRGILVKKKEGV